MSKKLIRKTAIFLVFVIILCLMVGDVDFSKKSTVSASDDVVVLRVSNWEEYIDLGEWDDDELIDLDNGEEIIGINAMVEDFEEWYYNTYHIQVKVEYSTFGTNEDLYNMLTLGDVYDLVCPSDYMIMKLMAEEALVPYSESFYDTEDKYNYYINGVSPYISQVFEENEINGESWSKYAAGYMWGITGMVYNPDEVSEEEASTWNILLNTDYAQQVTIKDNVRDSYFAALGILYQDELMSDELLESSGYNEELTALMNDVDDATIEAVEDILKTIKENVYSFETDSGKADMVSGKVLVNYQWSGDAVYTLDQAEEDDVYLAYAVPEESTNLWFDGWVMLESGLSEDYRKQHAAEAFVNFLSRPDNAVRNMYYIGYTSVISGGEDDDTVYEYLSWCYGAEDDEDEDEITEYALGYFFSGDSDDEDYILETTVEQTKRQLYAQYPDEDTINRAAIMQYYNDDANAKINQMWINVRCYSIENVPATVWYVCGGLLLIIICIWIFKKTRKKYY